MLKALIYIFILQLRLQFLNVCNMFSLEICIFIQDKGQLSYN